MLQAEVWTAPDDLRERGRVRHQLRLPVEGIASEACGALIHNLSETGLLIETADNLAIGEEIQVDLPQAGGQRARVVWNSERLFGCQFERPITKAGVSAALLRSPADPPQQAEPPAQVVSDVPQVLSPDGREEGDMDMDSAGVRRLPARTRVLVIAGLSVVSWALVGIPLAALAL